MSYDTRLRDIERLQEAYDDAKIEIAALGKDLEDIGNAYLRDKTAMERADKALSKLTLDKSIDPLTRAAIRNVVLDIRQALE